MMSHNSFRSRASRPGTAPDDPVAELRSKYRGMPPASVLAYELAMMIVQYSSVERWVFKINDEVSGGWERGVA